MEWTIQDLGTAGGFVGAIAVVPPWRTLQHAIIRRGC